MSEHHRSQRQCLGMVVAVVFFVFGIVLSIVLGGQGPVLFDYFETFLLALFGGSARSHSGLDQFSGLLELSLLLFAHSFHLHQLVVVLVVLIHSPGHQVEVTRLFFTHFLGTAGLATFVSFLRLDTFFVTFLFIRLRHHCENIVGGEGFLILVIRFPSVAPSGFLRGSFLLLLVIQAVCLVTSDAVVITEWIFDCLGRRLLVAARRRIDGLSNLRE
mmetsp:Transcript_19853/g.46298  ORF Transcript_19853/g.46298 Transcript_19853/m.46298 type:complete len:216 (-) Transcript_19853:1485-2132(-)